MESEMMKPCVFDADGRLINIGPWDEQIEKRSRDPQEFDGDGREIFDEVATNPLPDGAYTEECEVTQDADGGWVLAGDYAALRRAAYPMYSPYDILDEVLKVIVPEPGSKLEQMMQERQAVKDQYPKL